MIGFWILDFGFRIRRGWGKVQCWFLNFWEMNIMLEDEEATPNTSIQIQSYQISLFFYN